jgi:DNA polymerase-3 subunit delta'
VSHIAVHVENRNEEHSLEEFFAMTSGGIFPQAMVVRASRSSFLRTMSLLAHRYLCLHETGDDACASCRSWSDLFHPDLLVAGTQDAAPGIEECRHLAAWLSLAPFCAPRRLGVVLCADTLSLPAANSLLKIVEEPPPSAHLLLFIETNRLLPTLRSRVWQLSVSSKEPSLIQAPPEGKMEWIRRIGEKRGTKAEDMTEELRQWGSHLIRNGHALKAQRLEILRIFSEKNRLAVSMLQDLAYLALEEEYPVECLFDGFW